MELPERLARTIRSAMVARDADRLSTLRMLKSTIGCARIEKSVDTMPARDLIAIV